MMLLRFVYSFLLELSWYGLRLVALFNPKIKLFVAGRRETFGTLRQGVQKNSKTIWMHVASLGEYEQGLPILEKLRSIYPNHKIALTFFSPSGYEVKKNTTAADIVVYLPMDTLANAKKFMGIMNPELAIFIKYEIWPNYLNELKKRNIPTLLVSSRFSKKQIFFSPFGGFMRKSLKAFLHFFVQDDKSKSLLGSIGFENVTVSGDTRFDRVNEILTSDNQLDFMDTFKGEDFCMVAGSTWSEDEKILVKYINASKQNIKFVIAPHEIKKDHVDNILEKLDRNAVRYSEMKTKDLSEYNVLIVDTIGLLTKIYSYANLAYVGGGFATGLHNTLEPATFGIPVIIGPQYQGFNEAEVLVQKGGILSVNGQEEFDVLMNKLVSNSSFLEQCGKVNTDYLQENVGATEVVLEHIQQIL